MTILITSPDYDEVTSYLKVYTKELVKFAEKNGKRVNFLERPNLTQEKFSQVIKKQQPPLVLLNGHGSDKTIFGDKIAGTEKPLVQEGVNHNLLEGRMTYARACSAGASLGKTIVKKGGCFIGYKNLFQWWTDEKWHGNPAKDKTAQLFLEPTNSLAKALIKGKTAKDAANVFISESKKNILRLLRKGSENGALASVMLLWSNIDAQVVLGDEQMTCSAQ